MSTTLQADEFPVWALVPKRETGVTNFLAKNPSYDGRNVTIAIFDSGVDPGSPGLKLTSEGKPKVIARYDCSGAGDVDTSTIATLEGNKIKGLSGRVLVIPSTWKNPTGKYHIGIKNVFELYTEDDQRQIEDKKIETEWDPLHKPLLSKAITEQQNFNNEFAHSTVTPTRNQKLKKDDLDCTVEALQNLEKKYKFITPVYDCVVFHDGVQWLACLDTSEIGDLASCKLMGEFSEDPVNNFDYITAFDRMSYSFNVYNDGDVLEIVSLCSSHGTHVSAISAGYFPDEPYRNGVAPGAQIISLMISDSRLGEDCTETAIVRAMIKVMELRKKFNIDVINMSYTCYTNWSHAGRVGDIMNDVVDKHAVTWVASAGNNGPALCTIGAPPDISNTTIIGVGAYVSPDMMTAEYSMLNKLPGNTYTWSSRGPTIDGGRGISVCAPGGAITSVPGYLLRGSEFIDGTSMSAPHVAGATAVLISGLKEKNIDTCPYLIKRAMENTALYNDKIDHFSQGHGLLQVEKAFDYLTQYYTEQESYVKFMFSCSTKGHSVNGNKGIHIRNAIENKVVDCVIIVEPVFLNNVNVDADRKINFQMHLCLTSDVSWILLPKYLELMYMKCHFNIKVDPSELSPGVHTTTVRAYDVKNTVKGPVFTFEVTVVRPVKTDDFGLLSYDNVNFNPNSLIKRDFVLVPKKVSWATLHIKHLDTDVNAKFILHSVQLLPQKSCTFMEYRKEFKLMHNEFQAHFKVEENVVLEIALAKYWQCFSNIKLSYKLQFHGVIPQSKNIAMYHGMGLQSVILKPGIKNEEIQPFVSLNHLITNLSPIEGKITALTYRDVIPPQRLIYQLNLSYAFYLPKSSAVYATCGLFDEINYESEYESQLWMWFDSNKQYIAAGNSYYNKLDKGDYTIKMQVRHERRELLQNIIDLPIQVVQQLKNQINLDVYSSHHQATIFGEKSSCFIMTPNGDMCNLYIGSLSNDEIISLKLLPGHCLTGNVIYAKDKYGEKVDTYNFKYFITDTFNTKYGLKPVEENNIEEFNTAMCETKLNWLTSLEYGEDSRRFYDSLCKQFGDRNSSVHTSWIQCIEPENKKIFPNFEISDFDVEKVKLIIIAADRALNIIDQVDLLAFYGIEADQRREASKIKISKDRLKNIVVEALCRKGAAMCQLYFYKNVINKKRDKNDLQDIDDILLQVARFIPPDFDFNSLNYFNIWHGAVYQNYGRLMKILLRMLEDEHIKEVESCLLWTVNIRFGAYSKAKHLEAAISNALVVHYPKTFRPF
ncbi:tripeptidyl-peptidase 2-like [Metopolophium dirhodum]|uniref:tripeptidyl-peptidase 2-like n=1 Tax=Metopolophium dirhodum TaxID=44670 RepID=UPI0029903103|nr:tripeptidyl-peptidase 2-like [Metopolophium dirhodum]